MSRSRDWTVALTLLVGLQIVTVALLGTGTTAESPSPQGVVSDYTPRSPITIVGNDQFATNAGVIAGSGSPADPYIIEGWEIEGGTEAISILDTTAHFVIRNVFVHGSLLGIHLSNVTNGRLENVRTSHNLAGLELDNSVGIVVAGSAFDSDGIIVHGDTIQEVASHSIGPENLVNGRPLRYHANCRNQDVVDVPVGQLIVANCEDVRIRNVDVEGTSVAIALAYVDTAVVSGGVLRSHELAGIRVHSSRAVTITEMTITQLRNGSNGDGMFLWNSASVAIVGSLISNSMDGLRIVDSIDVAVSGNTFASNEGIGVSVSGSSGTIIHRNDFLNNGQHAYSAESQAWDAGDPSGGNYWSGESVADRCRGPQ